MTKYAACTIVTKPYLAYARALALSLAEHNPDVSLYVLLADRIDGYFDPASEPYRLVLLDELAEQAALERMCFYYTPFELCCSVRPLLHRYVLENTDHETWLFLDSDIMIYGSLEPIIRQLQQTSILLNPHCWTPTGDPAIVETSLLRYGIYNGGFLGLRSSGATREFIAWWWRCLQWYGSTESPFSGDQPWLNLVPLFFREVDLLRHPGANVGYWNLHERSFAKDAHDRTLVNGEPLMFAHFSGADLKRPERVFQPSKRFHGPVPPVLKELFIQYVSRLRACDVDSTSRYPCAFDRFRDGTRINETMRRLYHADCLAERPGKESAFSRGSEFRRRSRHRTVRNLLRPPYRRARRLFGPLVHRLRGLGIRNSQTTSGRSIPGGTSKGSMASGARQECRTKARRYTTSETVP